MTDSNNRFEAEALEAGGGAEARCPLCGLISERRVARHDDFRMRLSHVAVNVSIGLPIRCLPSRIGSLLQHDLQCRRSWSATELYAKFMEGRRRPRLDS